MIFQPNSPNSSTIATSFTSGLAIRKLSVTPSGTPAATNPMNAGTAEHEQNGVTTPRPAAATLPTPSRLPPSSARVRSTDMKLRRIVTTKITPVEQQRDLGDVVEEEVHRPAEPAVAVEADHVEHHPVPPAQVQLVERHPATAAAPISSNHRRAARCDRRSRRASACVLHRTRPLHRIQACSESDRARRQRACSRSSGRDASLR